MRKKSNGETVPYLLEENFDLLGCRSGLKNLAVSPYKTGILKAPMY
jgi:hypothetical protein